MRESFNKGYIQSFASEQYLNLFLNIKLTKVSCFIFIYLKKTANNIILHTTTKKCNTTQNTRRRKEEEGRRRRKKN